MRGNSGSVKGSAGPGGSAGVVVDVVCTSAWVVSELPPRKKIVCSRHGQVRVQSLRTVGLGSPSQHDNLPHRNWPFGWPRGRSRPASLSKPAQREATFDDVVSTNTKGTPFPHGKTESERREQQRRHLVPVWRGEAVRRGAHLEGELAKGGVHGFVVSNDAQAPMTWSGEGDGHTSPILVDNQIYYFLPRSR
jgi:hypothetical protein